MSITELEQNTLYYLELFVTDAVGDPVTGLSTTYKIYKSSDNSVVFSGSLIDVGDGVYKVSYLFDTLGQYRIIYTTPTNYTDEIETINVIERRASSIDVRRILGLVQENFRILNPVYDRLGNLVTCTIRIYPSASDVDADTNAIATYVVEATHNKTLMTGYKVKKL